MKPTGSILVDTNVLVYAYQKDPTPKTLRARPVVEQLGREGRGVISLQNLAEVCSVCLTRLKPPAPVDQVRGIANDLTRLLRLLTPDGATVTDALNGVERHGLSFWDAMIWAVAKREGVVEILSEDFQSGREVEGVLFTNPL